ncbi:hypothetical protein HYZ70_01840 [Candidatus Curtissbacteria bacterium]|nr:hypothetical protein [Candidatus Curtissbacteria bacterium]
MNEVIRQGEGLVPPSIVKGINDVITAKMRRFRQPWELSWLIDVDRESGWRQLVFEVK